MVTKKASVKKAAATKKTPANKKIVFNQTKPRKPRGKEAPGKRISNGGSGRGQGRKPGATTTKTKAIADKLVADGDVTPLEHMLKVLRQTPEKLAAQYKKDEIDIVQYQFGLKRLEDRQDKAAADAAHYIHPRLSSVTADVNVAGMEEWLAMLEAKDL